VKMLYIKLLIEREKNIGQSAPECPFKTNTQTLADICGYEWQTNLQNFAQKRLNRSENIPKSFREGGGLLF